MIIIMDSPIVRKQHKHIPMNPAEIWIDRYMDWHTYCETHTHTRRQNGVTKLFANREKQCS